MYRLNNLSYKNDYKKYKDCSNLNFSESLADESYYCSSAEACKRVTNNSAVEGFYDFPDGVDNGKMDRIANLRRRGVDMAVIAQSIVGDNADLETAVDDLNTERKKIYDKVQKEINSRKNNVTGSDVTRDSGGNKE